MSVLHRAPVMGLVHLHGLERRIIDTLLWRFWDVGG